MSKKNIKNNKKNSNRKNFKIEALEPRLMMSADPVIDFSDFDVVDSQLADLRDAAKNETASTVSAQTQSVVFQVTDSADLSLTKISDFLNNVDSNIETFVENAFDYAKNNAKAYIDSYNKANPDLDPKDYIHSIGISDFLTYVKDYIDSTAASYSFKKIDGSTIDVGYKYNGTLDLNELGFGSAVDYLDEFKSVKNLVVNADISFSLNLNSDNNDVALENVNDITASVSIDKVTAKIDNLGANTKFMNIEVNEVLDSAEKAPDLEIGLSSGNVKTGIDFEFDIDSSFLPFKFKSGNYLEVSGTDLNNINVSFPEVEMKNNPTDGDFSLDGLLKTAIDVSKLPFLKEFEIPFNGQSYDLTKVADIIGEFNDYWARTSVALNGIVDDVKSELDVTNLERFFKILYQNKSNEIDKIFNTIKLYEASSEKDFVCLYANPSLTTPSSTLTSPLGLSVDANNPTTLTLEFKPNLGNFTKEIDFNLFKLKDFDIDATLKVDVQVYLDKGILKFNKISLNDFVIKLTKPFTNENVHIGLFDTKLSGTFDYTIRIGASGLTDSSVVLSCDDIELKSGNVTIYKKPTGSTSLDFKFNMVESVWEFPDDLKQYFALSGETLANNVGMYLNSLRTSLRSLIEDRVKLNFLGDSAGSLVADTIANIDKVLYGEKKIDEATGMETVVYEGLFKVKNGVLVANFDSVESFKKIFNEAWSKTFNVSDVCDIEYLGNKVESADVVTFENYAKLEDSVKDAFKFDHYVLTFALEFGIDKSINLNLVDALGNSFANVSTYGAVSAKGKAGINFSLDVNFKHENLKADTKLVDFWKKEKDTDPVSANETYVDGTTSNYINGAVVVSVVNKDKKEIDTLTIDSSSLAGTTTYPQYSNKNKAEYYFEDNQVVITCSEEFDLCAAEGSQQNYGELRLGASTLQTTVTETITVNGDVSQWKNDLILSFGSAKSLKIPQNVLSDLVGEKLIESAETDDSAKLKDLLNQYFNLQYNSDLVKELKFNLGMKDSSDSRVVAEGRTIMNTFGLYVVSVEGDVTSGFKVRFGCDEKRIQEYGESGFTGGDTLVKGGKTTYMRVSGALKTTGVVGSEIGLMLEKYSLNADNNLKLSDFEYIDLTSIFGNTWDNDYSESEESIAQKDREDLSTWLNGSTSIIREGKTISLPSLSLGSQYEVLLREFEDVDTKIKKFSLGVAPQNAVTECYDVEVDAKDATKFILKKYALVNNALTVVDSKRFALSDEYKGPFTNDKEAKSKISKLQLELNSVLPGAFVGACTGDDASGYRLTINVAGSVNSVTALPPVYRSVLSDNFMTISSGSSAIHVDTSTCRDLPSLAQAIKNTVENDPKNALNSIVNSIAVNNDKIVFALATGSSLTCSALKIDSTKGTTADFKVNGNDVDFDDLKDASGNAITIDDTTKLVDVVEAINRKIKADGITLKYSGLDAGGNPVNWDHLEFHSQSSFDIESVGLSRVLEQLGFANRMKAVQYGEKNFRIVGHALLGADWSKLIDFTAGAALDVFANASLEVGEDFVASNSQNDKNGNIVFESSKDLNFAINGLVKTANGNLYKILEIDRIENKDPVTSEVTSVTVKITVSNLAEGNKDNSSYNLTTQYISSNSGLHYMAGAVANVGFVDVDLVASGKVGFDAKFKIKKAAENEVADALNYKLTVESPIVPSGKFTLDSFVDIGDKISENLGSVQIGLDSDGKLEVANSTELDTIVNKVLDKFSNFSAEDMFAILDTLVKRVRDIADKSNVKIPVINKSVSDLVNVAENICDIVNKLRSDKVTSLQGINDRLNKYLIDYGLLAHTDGKINSALNPFVIEIADKIDNEGNVVKVTGTEESVKVLKFSFNIDKSFKSVHQFSFGNETGISGNANLDVIGDFWFSLCGQAEIGKGSFDLVLTDDIKFGASVNILGEKLSFNLGLDNITDTNLLANLITVGSNSGESCVKASACLTGAFKLTEKTLSIQELKNKGKVECDLSVKAYGKLPVSVANFSLGNIVIGKCDNKDKVLGFDDNDAAYSIDIDDGKYSDFKFDLITKKSDFVDVSGTDRFVVDMSDVYTKIADLVNGEVGWFEKIKLAITGFNTLFDTLESQLNDGMMSEVKEVPVVGSALSGGVDFLGDLKRKVLEPFSDFVYETSGMTAEMVAQQLSDLFGKYAQLVDSKKTDFESDGWTLVGNGVYYRSDDTAQSAEWFFTLGGKYSFGNDIGLDLGFPGLGLETNAGLDLGLTWNLNFGMKVSQAGGLEFIFSDENDVSVGVTANLSGDVLGKMAGLGVKLDFDSDYSGSTSDYAVKNSLDQGVYLSFGVDLDQDLKTVKLSDIFSKMPKFNTDASVNMVVGMTVGVVSDVKDNDTPKFPNVSGKFEFVWHKGEIKNLAFNDFKLDMGSFIGGVLGPIVSKIQKVVEPLESLIDFLTTPFPVLDDLGIEITPLSLAKQYSKGKFDDGMVYAVKDIIEISKKISKFSTKNSVAIDLGSLELIKDNDILGLNSGARSILAGSASNTSLDAAFDKYTTMAGNVQQQASSTLSSAGLNMGNSSWRFIWDNPTDVFKLLLGQDIALVEYDMPKLTFGFDWSTFIRIYGPLGARLGLSLGADINLGFGYDTLGIRQWIGTDCKDFGCLLNGFYVNDLRDGIDIDELSFHGALTAAAELNAGVSAGVGGGVGINVGFNLYDPNKDGKIRLGEMTQMFKEDGLFGFFDVNGKITAKLYAYVDLLFYTKEWNITGDKTLFEFKNERKSYPVMISKSGDDVVANIGTNAANRISTNGVNKTLSDDDEILYLKVDGEKVSDDYEHSETIDKGKLIINAEKGNDKIYIVSNGADAKFDIIINGGDGDDIIDLSGLKVAKGHYVLITGGAGADNIVGAQGLNIIFGDENVLRVDDEKNENGTHKAYRLVAGSNVVAKKSGDDVILGGSGHDIIFGGAGDDNIAGGEGEDYIFGDGGLWSVKTSLTALGKNADETIDLALRDIATAYGGYGNSIANISKDDVSVTRTDISLDGGADILVGGAGNDMIYGGAGNDRIDGGAGNDTIEGERGHDRILGGSGNDTISGGQGMDIIFGDRLSGDKMDVAEPFVVNSSETELSKKTTAFSKEFIDAQFKNGSSIAQSEFEFDIKELDKKGDESNKSVVNEDKSGTNGNDTINGDEGNDLIFGDDGSDVYDENKEFGNDTIYGGLGNDIIDGDGGSDTIKGGIDNDIIYGGDGDDIIDGGAGNDTLYGDNGVTDYKKKDDGSVNATSLLNGGDGGNKLVFGDNLGLHNAIYENAKSNGAGGNDKITTGPGMDFVDGQGGSDRITVKLMGDDSTNYANITDSGNNGMDSLFVEGTETDDQILVRMNEDKTLGFVALLPVDKEEEPASDTTPKKQKNSNIERVNIIKSNNEKEASLGINVLNVNANGGNDNIYVDGTVETTNIDGGAGNDNFIVGQLYNSDRTEDEKSARIQNVDVFNAVATNEESYLSDGVTDGTKLNLEGGSGSDGFVALNNVGTLNMSGGKDDDKFSVYSFRQKEKVGDEYKAFERGAVLIDGGKGNDSLNIRGTDDDDTFVVTKEGMLSDLVAIKAAGVESTQFDAAAGDDMFHVLSNNAGDVTELNGGMGNDTFSMGGLDEGIKNLRSANTDGQNVELTYEIVDGEDADESRAGLSQKESFTLVDTDVEPAVFILKKEGTDYKIAESPDLFIEKEGSEAVFYVGCAGLKTGESITVVISAPMLSNMDFNRGDRGYVISTDKKTWSTSITVSPTLDQPVAVYVMALADDLLEEGSHKAIAISSTWSNGNKMLTKSVTSVGVTFKGEDKASAVASLKTYPFAYTEEFVYNGTNEFKINSVLQKLIETSTAEDGTVTETDLLKQSISIYVNGVKAPDTTAISVGENGLITINSLTAKSGDKVVISVRTNALRIDDSKVALAYEGASITSVTIDGKAIGTFVAGCKQYYELNGNVITFYNGITGQPMTMHGIVSVVCDGLESNYEWENYAGASTAAPIHSTSGGFLTIEQHSYVLTESMSNDDAVSSDEDADPSSGAVTTPTIDFTSQTYNVTYNDAKSLADGKKVYVKITPAMLLANSSDATEYLRLSISCADSTVNADGSITIYFDNTTDTRSITVTAVCDDQIDDYGLTSVGAQAKSIEPIDGAVYAYGYGKSMDLDTGNPAMLKYNHVIDTGANKPQRAVQFNELNNFDSNKLFRIVDNASNAESNVVEIEFKSPTPQSIALLKSIGFNLTDDFDWDACLNDAELMNEFLAQFEHKTFKWVVEITKNVGAEDEKIDQTDTVVAAKWLRVESASYSDEKIALVLNETITIPTAKEGETVKNALISRNRDSIFVDEMASVDRLFVNNQEDVKDHLGENASTLNAFSEISGNISAEERTAIADNPEIENKDALVENLGLAENRVMEFDSNALRFNHSDIGSRGIAAAQMEYGEYNLGTGKDYVEINKTLYRDDAFRTFTVVNTGDSGNKNLGDNVGTATITSSSYNDELGLFCYEITSDDLWKKASYDSSAIYYVDAEIKKLKSDGSNEYETVGTQRREVVGNFSTTDGFNIKYDFILAEGEELGNLTFTQAEFDDEIVISKHQSDRENGNSTVICSGTKVSKNVSAPAEESAATETPVASEEPAAEGDTPAATEETGAAESESSTADTSAETETTGGEGTATADADKPAEPSGYVYSFTMNADDLSQFKNKYADFGTAKKNADEITEGEGQNTKTRTRDTNAYAFNLYVDATMSDGSVQRRVVNGMTSTTFGIDRDFTLSAGVTIVSVKFAYNYKGDGQLVINAQSGNDKIDASSNDVTRNDMVVFGGFGDDYITMNKGGIAFGDRGQVKYDNGKVNGVEVGETILGSTDGDSNHNGGIDYTTGIRKNHGDDTENKGPVYRLQTDGVNRDAKDIHSVDDANGGVDMIYVGGTNSVVIGGAEGDVIAVGGNKNVVLGDNGRVNYKNAANANAVYGDELGLGLYKVETTSDNVGDVDNIVIAGNKNVAMGGDKGDSIRITGADNVAIGDAGRYTVEKDRLYAESKQESDHIGGKDYISTGDGKNAVIGGTDNDKIRTGAGNDAIIGDGGIVIMDTDRNMLMVSNEGRNINKQGAEDGSAGVDDIEAGDGDNVVFGGLNKDYITTGSGKDVAFGDNGYATFRGNANEAWYKGYDETRPNVHDVDSTPTIYSEATLSFNFQGPAQNGIGANEKAGAVADYTEKLFNKETGETEEHSKHADYSVGNWNNIKGHESGTYGDNDDEIVLFDNGTRASAVSMTYGASEDHRVNTTDGDNIRLHGYTQEGRISASNSGDYNLMKSGLDTSGNNARNTLLAQVDGLNQYFTDYDVVVYLDMVQENSWAQDSVRVVTLYRDYVENGVARSEWVMSYYVNDPEANSFNGNWVVATATSAKDAKKRDANGRLVEQANCVIFKNISGDRFHVEITDGDGENGYNNGKDRAGIAGIQVKGRLHKQDVAASTDIVHGGDDVINTQGGDDVVVGGTGADKIRTFGDDRYGIYDNDVVYGDNAKMVFTDRDSNLDTASTISYAESIASKNLSVSYDDKIMSGNGNDVVVGGSGSDKIDTGATAQADEKLDGLEVFSLNFTDVSSNQSTLISKGESAGVVVDNDWHNGYLYNSDPRAHGEATEALEGITFRYDCYGNTNAPAEATNASMDADTSNNKMMMNYVAGHNQDPLTVSLDNIPTKFTANKYDVYVYIDGINNDSDAHGYVFKITGSNGKAYYLNDWSGNRFDGEFKEVTCTEYNRDMFKDGITPSVEMIGNYVVFRDVETKYFSVTIECVDTTFGTQKRNDLPVISAVQLVAGENREKDIAVGGDHDKDFVMGDDATLHFDLDIPFAGDESIGGYQNRLVSAKSTSVSGSSNSDKIWTGKDRDVVIGGEGNDQIDAGAGDDVVIGNTARNLYVEHNNPLGVFRPDVNIVLEDNDYNVAESRPYLDGQGGNKDQIRSMVQNGQVEGITLDNQNTGYDTVYGGNNNKDLVFINGHTEWGNLDKELTSDTFFAAQEDEVHPLPVPPAPAENPVSGNEEPSSGTEQPISGGEEPGNGEDPQSENPVSEVDYSETIISPVAFADLKLDANKKVKLVFETYPQFNDHIANLHLYFTGKNGKMFDDVTVELYSHGRLYRYDVGGNYWVGVDVQDRIDGDSAYGDGNCVLYIVSEKETAFTLSIGE